MKEKLLNGSVIHGQPTEKPDIPSNVLFMRRGQIVEDYGLSPSFIDRLEANKAFPTRIKLGGRAVAWLRHEVEAWALARVGDRDASMARRADRDELLPS